MTRKASSWEGQRLAVLRERWDRPHVHIYSSIDSTNTLAVKLAEEGAAAGTIVLADQQTSGRGVSLRRWHSPKGAGLYLSLVLRPQEVSNPLLLPLLAGLGTARAVETLVSGAAVAVKWPNDLIVADRKAGGVIAEAAWSNTRPKYIVLGIGVNVHQKTADFPAALRGVAIALDAAAGRTLSRLELADRIIDEVEISCLNPPEILDREFLRRFDDYDWLRDRRCSIDSVGSTPLLGTAVGIAPDGALLFRPDRGALQRVTAGHVQVEELPTPDF
ncbi:MAG: biotin--[acetyl-CoA-carboxylase] ligase [Gemmatimonadales bacterium]|jgi:BirA family biotin operon repressor/biotin-[acetyl-CoA-carboxylase] ligase